MKNDSRGRQSRQITRSGFTLAELLIVVAIIGVLVAIAIPIFNGQLERSRKAVDLANVRSAKAAAAAAYLSGDMTRETTYYYDAAAGTVTDLETARNSVNGYGKSHGAFDKERDGAAGTPRVGSARGVVAVTVGTDGTMSARWELKGLVDVTADNVNDYVTSNSDGTYTLAFEQGGLSFVNITDGKILKSVKDKSQVTSIVFGRDNLFQDEDNPLDNGDTNRGILFGRGNKSALKDYSSLEKIDFSGITIGELDMSNLSSVGVTKLKEVVLPDQDGLKFNIEGQWYYLDSNNRKVSLSTGRQSRVDTQANSYLKGKAIYKQS